LKSTISKHLKVEFESGTFKFLKIIKKALKPNFRPFSFELKNIV